MKTFITLILCLAFLGTSCGQDGDNGDHGKNGLEGKSGDDGQDGKDGTGEDGRDGEIGHIGPIGPMGPVGEIVAEKTFCSGETTPSSTGTKWWLGYKSLRMVDGSEFVVFNVKYIYQNGNFTSVSTSDIFEEAGNRVLKSANWTLTIEGGRVVASRPDKSVELNCEDLKTLY